MSKDRETIDAEYVDSLLKIIDGLSILWGAPSGNCRIRSRGCSMTERYITGVWTRWSDGEIVYWPSKPPLKKVGRWRVDEIDLLSVFGSFLRVSDLRRRWTGRWGRWVCIPYSARDTASTRSTPLTGVDQLGADQPHGAINALENLKGENGDV